MSNNNENLKSRRSFLSIFSPAEKPAVKKEMVKMLTPDGKLVEVEKEVLDALTKKQKATNKEIYEWMKNPSKDNNS